MCGVSIRRQGRPVGGGVVPWDSCHSMIAGEETHGAPPLPGTEEGRGTLSEYWVEGAEPSTKKLDSQTDPTHLKRNGSEKRSPPVSPWRRAGRRRRERLALV